MKSLLRACIVVVVLTNATARAQPNAYILSAAPPDSVKVVDLATNTVTATIPIPSMPAWLGHPYPHGVALSPDESRLYVANYGADSVTVIDTTSHLVIGTVSVGHIPIGVTASPNGTRIYVACHDGSLWSVDAATLTVLQSVAITGGFNSLDGITASADGSALFVTDYGFGGNGTLVYVVNAVSMAVSQIIPVPFGPFAADVSADGSKIFIGHFGLEPGSIGQGTSVTVIDPATALVIGSLSVGKGVNDLAVSRDGLRLYTANHSDSSVSVVDLVTGLTIANISVASGPRGIDVTSDGSRVVVTSDANVVTVLDGTTFATISTLAVATPTSFGKFIATGAINPPDATPPTITSVVASAQSLWPPDHRMFPVTITATATDAGGQTSCRVVQVASNEPQNGLGDGDTPVDWTIISADQVVLRAERSGRGDGRQYVVTVECSDPAGNVAQGSVGVSVPKNQGRYVPLSV